MRSEQLLGLLIPCVLVTTVTGCGKSGPNYPTARLEGRVVIDGAPVTTGQVQFIPAGKSQPASALVKDGHYLVEHAPLGKVRVLFTAIKETGRTLNEGGHTFPERVSLIPAKYRSGIDLDVAGDNPAQDFLLNVK